MVGDGENVNNLFSARTSTLDDTGTRFQFLAELYELWVTGLDILDRYDKHSPFYEEKKKELENALKLLGFHMVKDYDPAAYRIAIDALPKHGEDIKDENHT